MSDDYSYEEEEAPPRPDEPAAPLVDFVSAFTDPQAQEVFRDAAVQVQNYVTQRQIADDNAAAASRLVSNLGQFKDGLVGMVQSDPAALMLGLDLVPNVVEGVVQTHPYLADDQRQGTQDSLTSDMQREIARAGVMSWADRDAAAARQMLGHPKVTGLFDDQDRASLDGYISAMDTARTVDAAALEQQRTVDNERMRAVSAVNYFGALLNPQTYEVEFPPGWAERVTADPTLPPGDTAAMLAIYSNLQKTGDIPLSDPLLMADLVTAAANGNPVPVPGVLSQVGRNLRLTDALTLAAMAGPQTPEMVANTKALATTLQTFRNQVTTPENGPAGVAAFERFVNWIIPEFRGGGSLDPKAENYILPTGGDTAAELFWGHFAPRLDDFVWERPPGTMRSINELKADTGDRISLNEIFGPRRRSAGDVVIPTPQSFPYMGRMPMHEPPPMMGYAPAGNPTFFDENDNPSEPRYDNPEIKS